MQRIVSVLFVSMLLEGAWPCLAWASHFTFTNIDVPDSISTIAYGINDAGQIVGWFEDADVNHGFLLSEGIYTRFDVRVSVTSAANPT